MKKSLYYKWCMAKNLLYTLRFNFHYFKPTVAFRLPVVFYSPVKLRSMKGKILLPENVKFSMVSIGLPGNEMFSYNTPNIWCDYGGEILFEGSFGTNPGASFVIRKGAILKLGAHSSFGQNMKILCTVEINIGNELLASWDITIMDTDSHYFDINGKLSEFSNRISIGNHCFIGSGASILKGTSIADNVVIASRAVLSGKLLEPSALYAGVPARIKKHNIKYLK